MANDIQYYWGKKDTAGKRSMSKLRDPISAESFTTRFGGFSEGGYGEADQYNAPDIYDKQQLPKYNTKLADIASGKGKHYWHFQQDYFEPDTYHASAHYTDTGDFSEFSKFSAKHNPNAPGPQWMSAEESKVQTDIITQRRDTAQTNISARAQEFSNRQTQANISEDQGGGTGRGSSTRRKEKRGGRASTLLAGNLGGGRANVASKALLGG